MDDRNQQPRSNTTHRIKQVVIALLAVFFLCLTVLSATAASLPNSTLNVNLPSSTTEGDVLTATLSGPGNLIIERAGIIVASGTGSIADSWQTTSTSAGIYEYKFSSDDPTLASQSPSQSSQIKSVEVLNKALVVTPVSPATTDVGTTNVEFSLNANWPADMCYILIDGVGHTLNPASNSNTTYVGTFSVAQGVHSVEYKCTLGAELASASKVINVDTLPPTVTAKSPIGDAVGSYATLSVDTNELAQCKYGLTDASFDALSDTMSSASSAYALHSSAVVQITADGAITYYVRCKDVYGNAMSTSEIISFTRKLMPVASITHETSGASSPLRAGTYKVMLTTNIPLSTTPSLSYSFPESKITNTVVLSGDGSSWEGYIVIPQGAPDRVITFSFSGISIRGVIGTEISKGATVEIDAAPPGAVEGLAAKSSAKGIELTWAKPTTNVDNTDTANVANALSYKIYRSQHEGVQITDYFATTSATQFIDAGAADARYYYYRIAPVDAAGNIGELSQEVYGSMIDEQLIGSTDLPIDALSSARVNDAMAAIDSGILDANQVIDSLSLTTNPDEIKIIENMKFIELAKSSLAKLQESKTHLQALLKSGATPSDIDSAISDSAVVINNARLNLIKKIMPLQVIELKQPSDSQELERNIPYAIMGSSLDSTQLKSYTTESIQLQDHVSITLFVSAFRTFDANGIQKEYTYIQKTVLLDDPKNQMKIIEVIPKSVAQSVSEINFEKEPTVLAQDPVVAYDISVLQQEKFSYVLNRAVALDEVKKSRTFVFSTPSVGNANGTAKDAPLNGGVSTSSLTGFITKIGLPGIGSATDGVLILVGIVIIVVLGVYYVRIGADPAPFKGGPGLPKRLAPTKNMRDASFGAANNGASMSNRGANYGPYGSRNIILQPKYSNGSRYSSNTTGQMSRIIANSSNNISPSVSIGNIGRSNNVVSSSSLYFSSDAVNGVMSSADVESMLNDAEAMINKKSYDAALLKYKDVVDAVTKDEGLAEILRDQVLRVYTKLLLYRNISTAKQAVEMKNHDALKLALSDVRETAEKIGDDQTVLMMDAKSAYTEFVQQLNLFEIGKNEKY